MPAKFDVVVSSPVPSDSELTEQIERILRSSAFRGSEILRNLLSYLAANATEGRAEPLKVKEIATEVFGRSENFDSQGDSVVRVHTGRLRSKLAEYYMSDGVEDDLIITIPKGVYAVSSHYRQVAPAHPVSVHEPVSSEQAQPARTQLSVPVEKPAGSRRISLRAAGLLIIAAVIVTALTSNLLRQKVHAGSSTPNLQIFWQPFVGGDETPLIVFSNFRFLGSINSGLEKYSGPIDTDRPVIDTYTTMGEVMGVFEVGRLLTSWAKPVRAKRGKLLTWDEAKDSNLIFVGGPLAETPLRDVPVLSDLQFRDGPFSAAHKSGAVLNLHPREGEEAIYFGSDSFQASGDNHGSSFDYAVVAVRPALSPNHSILVIAGITEFGTQGAAEFVTRENHVTELLARLNRRPSAALPWFEALLRVRVEGGVPVQSDLVFVHQAK